jgi:hypothetical protein
MPVRRYFTLSFLQLFTNSSVAGRVKWTGLVCDEHKEMLNALEGRNDAMTVIYDADDEGNIIVMFDSRWRFPELLGYSVDDPQYAALQQMWEKATGRKIEKQRGIKCQ